MYPRQRDISLALWVFGVLKKQVHVDFYHFPLPAVYPCAIGTGFCCWVVPFSQGLSWQWANGCWPRAHHYFSCMRVLGFNVMQGLLEWMPGRSRRSAADPVCKSACGEDVISREHFYRFSGLERTSVLWASMHHPLTGLLSEEACNRESTAPFTGHNP